MVLAVMHMMMRSRPFAMLIQLPQLGAEDLGVTSILLHAMPGIK